MGEDGVGGEMGARDVAVQGATYQPDGGDVVLLEGEERNEAIRSLCG